MRASYLSLTLLPVVAFSLAGCNGVPISTQWKLRNFKLESADVSKLRVAVRTPDWATATPDKGEVKLATFRDEADPARQENTIRLQRGTHPEDAPVLAGLSNGAPLAVFEIAARDLPAARGLQQAAIKRKAAGEEKKATLGLAGEPVCRIAEVPPGPILIDAYIHPDDETGWLPLLDRFDMTASLDAEARRKIDTETPLCGKRADRVEASKASR